MDPGPDAAGHRQLWFDYNTKPTPPKTRTHYVATDDASLQTDGQQSATCIVCLGPFMDPVVCTLCQHCYCAGCVEDLLSKHCLRCGNNKFMTCQFSDAAAERALLTGPGVGSSISGAASPAMDKKEDAFSPLEATYQSPDSNPSGYSVTSTEKQHGKKDPFGNNLGITCPHCRWHGRKADYSRHFCLGPSQFTRDPGIPKHPNLANSPHRTVAVDMSSTGNLRALQLAECIQAVRSNKLNASAWFHLGECLRLDEDVAVLSSSVTKVGCYTASLHLDKTNERCWRALGMALQPSECCQVGGDLYSRRDCMIRSLMLEDSSAEDWTFLGTTIRPGEVIVLPRTSRANFPVHVSAVQCFRKALTYDSRYAPAYAQLSRRLAQHETIAVNGEELSRISSARYALGLDATQWPAWQALGEVLEAGELVTLLDGSEIGSDAALAMARTLRNSDTSALVPQRFS